MLSWSKFLILALFLINSIFVKADANKFSSSNVVVENFKCLPEKNSRFDPNTASSTDNLYMMMLASWLAHEKKSESRENSYTHGVLTSMLTYSEIHTGTELTLQ